MLKTAKHIKLGSISAISALAVTACAPSYQMPAEGQVGYGYENAAYGYDYVSDQTAYGYDAQQGTDTTYKSRYGVDYSGELRGPCESVVQSCGMMAVVPVYPIYQIVTPAPTFEAPVVEVPTVTVSEPEPIVIYEPEPVYEPPVYEPVTNYWPEPETPVTSWKPLRK